MRRSFSYSFSFFIILMAWPLGAAAQTTAPAHPIRRPDHDNPFARQQFFLRGRQGGPAGLSKAELLRRAIRQRDRLPFALRRREYYSTQSPLKGSSLPATSGSWTALGPSPENDLFSGNVSGRVTAIAIDSADDPTGNTVYVGAAYGGVWVTTNALSATPTWKPLTDGQPTLSVGAIALAPGSSAGVPTIIVGTGEPDSAIDSYYGQGILVSHDGGATWTNATGADCSSGTCAESFLGEGFSSILVDPVNPQIILAAASGQNIGAFNLTFVPGIFRSTDGGNTWSKVATFSANGYLWSVTNMTYDSQNATYIAAVDSRGFFKSTDQGQTWTQVTTPFANNVVPSYNFTTSYDNFYRSSLTARQGVVYAVISDSNGMLSAPTACSGQSSGCDTGLVQSTNDGATWTPIAAPVCPTGSGTWCASSDPLFNSDNQGYYDQPIAAPAGSTVLIVGGIDLWIAPTVNGMSTAWTDMTQAYGSGTVHPDEHVLAALNSSVWFSGNDGGVWVTQDGSNTTYTNWTDLNTDLNTIQFYGVSTDADTAGVYFGGSQDNDVAISGNGANPPTGSNGLTWTADDFGDGGQTASLATTINNTPTDLVLGENTGISLAYSLTGGSTQYPSCTSFYTCTPTSANLNTVVDSNVIKDASAFYVPFQLLSSNNGYVLLGTCRVWAGPAVPASDGANWIAISPDVTTGNPGSTGTCASNGSNIDQVAAAPSSPATIYAVTDDGNVAFTNNATCVVNGNCASTGVAQPTWTLTSALPLTATSSTRPLSSIAIDPTNPDKIYVGVQDFGPSSNGSGGQHIFMSSNQGTTWTDITGNLPNIPLNAILIDPNAPSNIYVGTDIGVFATTDGGAGGTNEQWEQLGAGLPASAVLDLTFSKVGPELVVAATHGRGAWTIPALPAPNFTLTAATASAAVAPGSTATYSLTITPTNGFNGTVKLTCTGAPSEATCTPNPASLTISSSAAASSTISVTTTAASGLPVPPPSQPWNGGNRLWLFSLGVSGFMLLLAGLWLRSRRNGWAPALSSGIGIALLGLSLAGCGGGSSSTPPPSNPGTPAGSYTLTVTATSGSITQSQSLTLTIN